VLFAVGRIALRDPPTQRDDPDHQMAVYGRYML